MRLLVFQRNRFSLVLEIHKKDQVGPLFLGVVMFINNLYGDSESHTLGLPLHIHSC